MNGYLLWKHPVLGSSKAWWGVGGVWSLLIFMAVVNGDKDKKTPADKLAALQVASGRPSRTKEAVRGTAIPDASKSVVEDDAGRTPVASSGSPPRTKKPKPEKVKKGINLENYERIIDGMTRSDVETMLGKGRELASRGYEKAIVYETKNLLTGSEKFIEVYYLDGRVTVKFKDGF